MCFGLRQSNISLIGYIGILGYFCIFFFFSSTGRGSHRIQKFRYQKKSCRKNWGIQIFKKLGWNPWKIIRLSVFGMTDSKYLWFWILGTFRQLSSFMLFQGLWYFTPLFWVYGFAIVTSSTVLTQGMSVVWSGDDGDALCSCRPFGLGE